jgi:uncharacterized protein YdiU (UPF0061 family)
MPQDSLSPSDGFADLRWGHRFAALGDAFFAHVQPTPLAAPYWVAHSSLVAAKLGLPPGWVQSEAWLQAMAGNRVPPGAQPLASVYSGHQFGVWAGQLGDGRALLLGELAGMELQLKGAGLTPFSRMGDGRAVLRSSLREFLCSEAMHGLGIPTSRALCITGSPSPVLREEVETAAVVARVAPSFIRFGHFEHFCHHDQHGALRTLADAVIDGFFPACRETDAWSGNPYAALLATVTERTADLMAHWQSVGFCHGVMNTDNMSILGLTLDYGPFQFLDAYDPAHICNHSDHQGRYAFARQPQVAYWNLFCLGQALMPLVGDQALALAALETYKARYPQAFLGRMAAKLGLATPELPMGRGGAPVLAALVERILDLLAADRVDYTIFWRRLSHWAQSADLNDPEVRDLFLDTAGIDAWLADYAHALADAAPEHSVRSMLQTNPKFVLRNHLGELAIRAAKTQDFSVASALLGVLERPFDEHPAHAPWADFAPDWASSIAISCSS